MPIQIAILFTSIMKVGKKLYSDFGCFAKKQRIVPKEEPELLIHLDSIILKAW